LVKIANQSDGQEGNAFGSDDPITFMVASLPQGVGKVIEELIAKPAQQGLVFFFFTGGKRIEYSKSTAPAVAAAEAYTWGI
jgi:hypothetical protein